MIRALRPLVLLFVLFVPFAAAQDGPATLTLQQRIEGSLAGGTSDSYVIDAEAEQFVAGAANQLSVDVIVKVFGPDDAKLEEFDGPAAGPEHFTFETKTAGQYRIEVAPFEEAAGDYTISLTVLEPIAKTGPGRVDQLMATFRGETTPGGVVTVVHEGGVLFEKAYGMANLTYAVPFSVATPSNLGSTSKQFTAFAIAVLDAEGALSIDDDVRKHIPELPEFDEVVTLRHFLTHTSGYREFLNTLSMAGRRLDQGDFIDRKELIGVVQRQPKLQNSPGAEFNYNNTGFGLLTVIVERVTGETFPDWMKKNVFTPLGMTNTVVRANPSQIIRGSSQGYGSGPNGYQDSRDLGAAMGAGAIYSTVGDLAKWMRNLQTGELGGQDVLAAMTTPFELTDGKSTGYGFGLFIDEQSSLKRIHHGGADSAHRAMLIIYPEIEAGVVALSNNSSFNSMGIASKIGEAFFAEHMQLDDESEAGIAEAAATREGEFDPATYEASDFDALAGRYELEEAAGFVLTFSRREDKFFTQATGQSEVEMFPTSALTFALDVVEAEVEFHIDEDGECTSLTLHQNGHHKAKRLGGEAWAPDEKELAAYTGRYFSEELETFYTLVVKEGQLVARHRRLEDMELTPGKQHEFAGPSGSRVTFVLSPSGEVWGFEAGNGRTRGVGFTRVR